MNKVTWALGLSTLLLLAGTAQADPTARSFFSDRRAYQPGDVLTVVITEIATVTARAHTQTARDQNANASIDTTGGDRHELSAQFGTNFSGGGQIERSGKLLATIAVTVEGVDERGNLTVVGDQLIVVNGEEQKIALHGVVRPEDIGPDNTVSSTRIGAARIELSGKGLLADRQRPGPMARFFAMLGW